MARIRTIKPEFFDDPDLAALPPHARLLFIGLWQQADKAGRLVEDARRLRARIFPYEPDVDVADLLVLLARGRFITRYQVDGLCYLVVRNFCRHQQPHVREPESTLPAPDEPSASPVLTPDEHPAGQQSKGREGKVQEGKGAGGEGAPHRARPREPSIVSRRNLTAAFEWRACVPEQLHEEFIAKLGKDRHAAHERLLDWYLEVAVAWDEPEERPIGDDDWKFWRLRFSEWQGTTKPKPPTVAEQVAAGKAKFLARTAMP